MAPQAGESLYERDEMQNIVKLQTNNVAFGSRGTARSAPFERPLFWGNPGLRPHGQAAWGHVMLSILANKYLHFFSDFHNLHTRKHNGTISCKNLAKRSIF